jgi:hypothetical protein
MTEKNIVENQHKINEWIRFACNCNEVPELAQAFVVEWNGRIEYN